VVVSTSVAPPLRVWLAGLVEEQSLASGQRACQSPYVVVEDVLSLVDSSRLSDVGALATQMQSMRPDAILLVGGSDQGAQRPIHKGIEALSVAALSLSKPARPLLVYAGNNRLQETVRQMASESLSVQVADNVRPGLEEENLGPAKRALETRYLEHCRSWDDSIDILEGWSEQALLTSSQAMAHTVKYLAQQTGADVLGLDLGAYSMSLAAQLGDSFTLSSLGGLGMYGPDPEPGSGIASRLAQWLPQEMDEGLVAEILASARMLPSTMAETHDELLVEQALARERISAGLTQSGIGSCRSWDIIVGGGGFLTHLPRPGQAALVLLDALQPVGVSLLTIDSTNLAPALGAIAGASATAAAQVLEQDAFLKLGTVVGLTGHGREGDLALKVKITYENGDILDVEVRYGSLEVIPLPLNQRADLELRPSRGFGLGLPQRQRVIQVKADGGVVGVVVDARGRPLHLPADAEERRQRVQEWFWALGA
jgi:hypothetical protein